MVSRSSVTFTKLALFKISTPSLPSFDLKAIKPLQFCGPLQRFFYTHVQETGIAGFERNRKLVESQRQGKSLPSWVENCRCIKQEEVEELYKAFPAIVEDVTTNLSCTSVLLRGNERLKNMCEHILPWSPFFAVQSFAVDRFYVKRAERKNLIAKNDDNHTLLALKLAWALEMIGRNIFACDDIIDASEKRNGLDCWHTLPNIGLHAINDYWALITGGLLVLDRYFKAKSYYTELVRFINEQIYTTALSTSELLEQGHDYTNLKGITRKSLSSFENFVAVKRLNNGALVMNLPMVATMIMHEVDPALVKKACEIGFKVVDACVMVEDCTDCTANVKVTLRESTDIQEGRITWLIWKAMDLGSPEQCQRLTECYGKNDANCVEEVKKIYEELHIKEIVSKMADDNTKEVEAEITRLPQDDLPCHVWQSMLDHNKDVAMGKASRL